MRKKTLSAFLGLVLGASTILGSIGANPVPVSAGTDGITDSECTTTGTAEPASDEVVPDANQYKYQKDELAAFCHFGPNTFNEIEWGEHYGDKKPNEIFTLTNDFDADTLVGTLHNAGFKKIIVTAKHHDGFCIWNSEYTDYCIKNTDYKNGKGDVLAEISAACSKYNMDMGLYLSPWDIHEPSYGYYDANGNPTTKENDVLDYNEYYNNQLKEILGNPKYGNKGHFVEVWMDGAKGSGANAQEYTFEKWFDTIQTHQGIKAGNAADCMLFGAQAYTTVRWIGNEDGVAHENTWAKSKVNVANNTIDSNGTTPYTIGYEDGNKWTVPECDGRITSGWFWGTQKCTPKTVAQLANMYFDSVGHNATMLLNVPPNNKGTVDQPILNRITEFGQNVEESFRTNLAKAEGTTIVASDVRGNDAAFKPGNVVDGNDATYWTTNDGTTSGSLTIKWNTAKKFDVVSIEEAIQKGQHINSYKVEYKASDDAQWQTLKSGVTVGAKRLVRTAPVAATQVKITVGTTDGKVPMLSEVGVYKASEGFQLAGAAPEGMVTTSVNDTNSFTFSTGWNPQTGSQYINGQNTWSNRAGASFTYKFHGTKVYLMGTTDPGHGAADVYIDNQLVKTINTHAESRSTGAKIFVSDDLEDGNHTLKLVAKTNAAIGVEAAYVINNGGVGMIELENSAYTMNEESSLNVKIKRVGGTKGAITAKIQPNPGSAIQDDFNTELAPVVTLNDGQAEVTVKAAETRRNTNMTGDRVFSIELTEKTPDNAIIGFNSSARITIKDADGITKEKLNTLITQSPDEAQENLYMEEGWSAYAEALEAARAVVENKEATEATIRNAYIALENAKKALVAREKYTETDRFKFPWKPVTSAKLEAEFATELNNSNDSDSDPDWPLTITSEDWASNGKFLNCMAYKDYAKYAYIAAVPGTYTVTGTYRAGALNKLAISEADNKIEAAQVDCPSTKEGNALTVKTFTLDIKVITAGAGTLILTAPDTNKAPQLDKLDIVLKRTADEADLTELEAVLKTARDKLAEVNAYTPVSRGELETAVNAAQEVYDTAGVTQDEVNTAKANVEAKIAALVKKADKSALINAINLAIVKTTQEDKYTAESREALKQVIDAAAKVVNDENATQEMVDVQTAAVKDAEAKLVAIKVPVNKSGLETLVYQAKETVKETETYTVESLQALQAAIDAAQAVLDNENATQETVDAQTSAINAAMNALVKKPVVDKTELKKAVDAAKEFASSEENKEKYTEDSWKTLEDAMKAAQDVLDKPEATQKEVDDALTALTEAKENLKTKEPSVEKPGKAELEETVNDAKAFVGGLENPEMYTEESLNALNEAIESAEIVLASETATQDEIDAAMQRVKVARRNLTPKKPAVDTKTLEDEVAKARELVKDTATYTQESLKALQTAIDAAQKVLDDADAAQENVDKQTEAVRAAMKALVKIKVPAVTDKLKDAVREAEELVKDTEKYSEESRNALTDAIALAQEVLEDTNATQETVDKALEAVNAAKEALVEVGNLRNVVDEAAKLTGETDKYTEDSVKALQAAIDEAKKVLGNPKATKDEVATALNAVNKAKEELKVKEADKKDEEPKKEEPKKDPTNENINNGSTNGGTNNGTSNTGSGNNGSTTTPSGTKTVSGNNNSVKAAKTGDTTNVVGLVVLCLAAGVVMVMVKKKRAH